MNTIGKQISSLSRVPFSVREDLVVKTTDEENSEVPLIELQEIATLVNRLMMLSGVEETDVNFDTEFEGISEFIDEDLKVAVQNEVSPDYVLSEEKKGIHARILELTAEKKQGFGEFYIKYRKRLHKLIKLSTMYEQRQLGEESLSTEQRNIIGRQLIIELKHFQQFLKKMIQVSHNMVSIDGRSYKESDTQVISMYTNLLEKTDKEVSDLFANNYEIAIQSRIDDIRHNAHVLKGGKKGKKGVIGTGFITPKSREATIYGAAGADNYILASMRNGNNVELLGPTGTGKTRLAMEACVQFSGKKGYIISGGPGVSRRDFYGATTGLDKRNAGAIETCIKEDKVLVIDEDNRIDPRVISEVKLLLGLKLGDTWIHPDTGEELTIPPHFRILVTRNEKGKHHTDRYDLPPDYRREFTLGSFEIGYYTAQEMYDDFLIPKLINDDGSISLSPEEIGGNVASQETPLLALVLAATDVQEAYKKNELKNAVFESGFMIDVLDAWKEVRFKKGKKGQSITFLNYLETKLLEFLKRPIANPDRAKIIEILTSHGFFKNFTMDMFVTENDGNMLTQTQFDTCVKDVAGVFDTPTTTRISAQEVALLDPFDVRKIEVPEHPLEDEIMKMATSVESICSQSGVGPPIITGSNIDTQVTRNEIIDKLIECAEQKGTSNLSIIKGTLEKHITAETEDFINAIVGFVSKVFGKKPSAPREGVFQEDLVVTDSGIKDLVDSNEYVGFRLNLDKMRDIGFDVILASPDIDHDRITKIIDFSFENQDFCIEQLKRVILHKEYTEIKGVKVAVKDHHEITLPIMGDLDDFTPKGKRLLRTQEIMDWGIYAQEDSTQIEFWTQVLGFEKVDLDLFAQGINYALADNKGLSHGERGLLFLDLESFDNKDGGSLRFRYVIEDDVSDLEDAVKKLGIPVEIEGSVSRKRLKDLEDFITDNKEFAEKYIKSLKLTPDYTKVNGIQVTMTDLFTLFQNGDIENMLKSHPQHRLMEQQDFKNMGMNNLTEDTFVVFLEKVLGFPKGKDNNDVRYILDNDEFLHYTRSRCIFPSISRNIETGNWCGGNVRLIKMSDDENMRRIQTLIQPAGGEPISFGD